MNLSRKFLFTVLAASMMVATGCGGDDGGSNNAFDGNNSGGNGGNTGQPVLSYSDFDSGYDENDETYLMRSEVKFYQTGVSTSYRNLFGNTNQLGETLTDVVFLADDFEYMFKDYVDSYKLYMNLSDIVEKVDENAIYISYDASNGKSLKFKDPYVHVDIAGYGLSVYNKETGVYVSELNDFEHKNSPILQADLEGIKFPDGSVCTTFLPSGDFTPFYSFSIDHLDTSGDVDKVVPHVVDFADSLEEVIASQGRFNPDALNAQIENVGIDGKYRAIHFSKKDDDYEYAYVEYNGKVYYADYNVNEADELDSNIDPSSEVVYCDGYNDIAADFIEDKLLTYYGKK